MVSSEYHRQIIEFYSGTLDGSFSIFTSPDRYSLEILSTASDLDTIASHYGRTSWTNLTKLRILDLGCGSVNTERRIVRGGWPPYFALMASLAGADVTGVDINAASPEDATYYKHIQADLVPVVKDGKLAELVTGPFDAIRAQLLYTSPGMDRSLKENRLHLDIFKEKLAQQIALLLVQGGIFLETDL